MFVLTNFLKPESLVEPQIPTDIKEPYINVQAIRLAESVKTWWYEDGHRRGSKPRFVLLAEKVLSEAFEDETS
jgi:hypothetical protein